MKKAINDCVFVVKSHERVDRFFDKTYSKIILGFGFELAEVYVFVSTESDVELYKAKYPEINIIKAPKGVAAVDNFITDYFPADQKIIYMNDDVSQVLELKDGKLHPIEVERFLKIVEMIFKSMERNKISYGGFYPVANEMFMAGDPLNFGLTIIMDPLSFVINNKEIEVTIADKSDFEKSIQHFNSRGALLRYNHIAIKAEYYGTKGGFQGRDAATELETANRMFEKYPEFISGVKIKKGGKTSLRLKNLEKRIRII